MYTYMYTYIYIYIYICAHRASARVKGGAKPCRSLHGNRRGGAGLERARKLVGYGKLLFVCGFYYHFNNLRFRN